MCGIKSRIFLLGLAVLLLLPSYSFSAVVLTDEQEKALNQHLEGLEKELKSAKEKLSEQKNELSQAKSELSEAKKELTEAQSSLKESKETLNEQKDTLQQLEKSLKQEKRQQRWTTVKVGAITFAVGLVVGAGTGYYFAKR